jgi:hypothetical protein
MRKAHREAADLLYSSRNSHANNPNAELYIDLHGLHPEEAIEYLERVLLEQQNSARPVYTITGTGHHSKNGKDKVGKAVRAWLIEWKYAFREFSVPGDRGNVGGILGIDARSFERKAGTAEGGEKSEDGEGAKNEGLGLDMGLGQGKITLVKKEVPTGPRGKG